MGGCLFLLFALVHCVVQDSPEITCTVIESGGALTLSTGPSLKAEEPNGI